MELSFEISGKQIDLFGMENEGSPLVILNTYSREGEKVYEECRSLKALPFTLASISKLNWDDDMSPWAIPPLYKKEKPCSGKADQYLEKLTSEIIPAILEKLSQKPSYIGIAGYSLGGLFALYASYKSEIFSKIASASGSLWFPNFVDFAEKRDFAKKPDSIYLSLGDTEAKTKNKILAPVQENTERLADFYKSKGIPLTFELNKGNHFTDGEKRMAKGLKWILDN